MYKLPILSDSNAINQLSYGEDTYQLGLWIVILYWNQYINTMIINVDGTPFTNHVYFTFDQWPPVRSSRQISHSTRHVAGDHFDMIGNVCSWDINLISESAKSYLWIDKKKVSICHCQWNLFIDLGLDCCRKNATG